MIYVDKNANFQAHPVVNQQVEGVRLTGETAGKRLAKGFDWAQQVSAESVEHGRWAPVSASPVGEFQSAGPYYLQTAKDCVRKGNSGRKTGSWWDA